MGRGKEGKNANEEAKKNRERITQPMDAMNDRLRTRGGNIQTMHSEAVPLRPPLGLRLLPSVAPPSPPAAPPEPKDLPRFLGSGFTFKSGDDTARTQGGNDKANGLKVVVHQPAVRYYWQGGKHPNQCYNSEYYSWRVNRYTHVHKRGTSFPF